METVQKFCYLLVAVGMEEGLKKNHYHFMYKTKLMVVLHKHKIMSCICCH